jgi:hypothetical protein
MIIQEHVHAGAKSIDFLSIYINIHNFLYFVQKRNKNIRTKEKTNATHSKKKSSMASVFMIQMVRKGAMREAEVNTSKRASPTRGLRCSSSTRGAHTMKRCMSHGMYQPCSMHCKHT